MVQGDWETVQSKDSKKQESKARQVRKQPPGFDKKRYRSNNRRRPKSFPSPKGPKEKYNKKFQHKPRKNRQSPPHYKKEEQVFLEPISKEILETERSRFLQENNQEDESKAVAKNSPILAPSRINASPPQNSNMNSEFEEVGGSQFETVSGPEFEIVELENRPDRGLSMPMTAGIQVSLDSGVTEEIHKQTNELMRARDQLAIHKQTFDEVIRNARMKFERESAQARQDIENAERAMLELQEKLKREMLQKLSANFEGLFSQTHSNNENIN